MQVSQIELLGSMTISTLNEILVKADASAGGSENLVAGDSAAKYGHALVPILSDRHADGEPRPSIKEVGDLSVDTMGMEASGAEADQPIEVFPVKKNGIQPRVFMVHDITGVATPFMSIGAHMPNEMYAIGDKHFGSPTGFSTIESMADHYITLVKSVQPQGPYIVAGYSFGGHVAICMADKLTRAGETIQHVILLDPIYIPATKRQSLKSIDWIECSDDHISSLFPDIGEEWKNKLRTEIQKNLNSMFNFDPPHYEGRATLIVPKDRSWYRSGNTSDWDTGADDHNGWDCRIKNLDMKISAGAHNTMFAPAHVKVLAAVMKEILGLVSIFSLRVCVGRLTFFAFAICRSRGLQNQR